MNKRIKKKKKKERYLRAIKYILVHSNLVEKLQEEFDKVKDADR